MNVTCQKCGNKYTHVDLFELIKNPNQQTVHCNSCKTTFTVKETEENKTMKTQHTPGPWYFTREGLNHTFILEADGSTVMSITATLNSTEQSHLEANTQLIAASPDLLAALEEMIIGNEPALNNSPRKKGYDMAIAAIRKARGNHDIQNNHSNQ